MDSTTTVTEASTQFDELKARLKATWMTGDYDTFSRYMEKETEILFRRLRIARGSRLLDVACGAGQLALIAARAGLPTHGCDIATNWLEAARVRAASEGLAVTFEEGDAEALPYDDEQFDVVTSVFGAMFAPRPELVAAELARVCKPGGTIVMANWTADGFIGKMFRTIASHLAPSGLPSPVLWGSETTVRERLGGRKIDLKCTTQTWPFDYPFSPEEVVEFFRTHYGPMSRAFASLDEADREGLRKELVELWSSHNTATDGTTKIAAEYLEVVGTKRLEVSATRRAEALARRIEQGAVALADFAEGLSDAEWEIPVVEGGKPGRRVGVIVHHVASVYPIEVDLARGIASGKAITDVTWEVVAGLNAAHAGENGGVSKRDTLELLLKNGREAAAAVRAFTDDQLDVAAPFSLSYGAPMTAQFVIEDHALRHSWHHLARIRAALGR